MIFIFFILFVHSAYSLNCSGNLQYGYSSVTSTIQSSLGQFTRIVGSFYNDTWYSYPVVSSTGSNNEINSTRLITDSTNTLRFNETLIEYYLNQSFFKLSWSGPGDTIKTDDFGTFILGSYIETLIGQSICSNSGVAVNFSIEFCATNLSTATSVLDDGHITGIQQVRTLLNISDSTTCYGIDLFQYEYIIQKNGYECFVTQNNITRCTCPDNRSTINHPCQNHILFGSPCPDDITTTAISISTEETNLSSSSVTTTSIDETSISLLTETTTVGTTTTEISNTTKCQCKSISNQCLSESYLIVLLNLVYFVNK